MRFDFALSWDTCSFSFGILTDSGHRKVPPDRPAGDGQESRKKKKVEEVPQAIMDDRMEDKKFEETCGDVTGKENLGNS